MMDISVAGSLLILLFPLILLIGFILLFYNRGKVFFNQVRPGKGEKLFLLYKFRTMRPESLTHLSDDERITKFGHFLRKTSLDELPQLINVIKGDMSLVGPRPLLIEYLPLYSDRQRKRHSVLPGITGLAQVNGRNSISWKDKFDFDVQYVENLSFGMDLKILLLSFSKVFSRKGIYDEKAQIVEKFKGNEVL
jgi:undecaprenyl phosphate N,N'-diacetylbacillosamine 1-phosphate transferase